MKTLLAAAMVSATLAFSAAAAESLSYVDLIKRLTDLEQLAALPAAGEKCEQWSSYDRKSRYDTASGEYIGWDANGDGDGYIRKEGDQFVFAEMEGPGCIWRIWSAAPKEGHVRIYLDGATEPTVDLPFMGYFDGKNAPFTRSALVHTVALGWNNYVPIPYRKSCKIVADKNWGAYFQFVYTTFPKGTVVPTFKRELSAAENAALDSANAQLAAGGPRLPAVAGEQLHSHSISSSGGGESSIKFTGPSAIRTLRLRLDPPIAKDDRKTLREWAIAIHWDGEAKPAVWAPLGDFFGTAAGPNAYRSLPVGLTADGWFYSHWFMPFAKSAEVKFVNHGPGTHKVLAELVTVPLKGDASRLGRFHAKWHRDAFLPAEPERAIDWTMLKTEGRGRFLGVLLHVWNPRGSWWGEGDEKFFVDGEKFPSTIGTGSEDYFGYAWCNPTLFENCYHNQTISMNNRGHISVNRWHIADNIPFQTSFEGAIEKYYANQRPTLYASTVYWYLAPGGKDPYEPVSLADRTTYWNDADLQAVKVKGALEGEELKILSKTGGNPAPQDMSGFGPEWSGESHLWWIQSKPGDKLELAVPVSAAGRFQIKAQFTKARDYGILQLTLDGKKLGSPMDFYNPDVVPTGAVDLGTHELSAGEHKLGIEVIGANDKAVKSYMFGLDYLKLEAR